MPIICLYVYYLIFTQNQSVIFEEFKKFMMVEFDIYNIGMMHYFLGIEIVLLMKFLFHKSDMYEKFSTGFK